MVELGIEHRNVMLEPGLFIPAQNRGSLRCSDLTDLSLTPPVFSEPVGALP